MADRFCRNCGHELAENDRFCPNCGTPVDQAAHVPTPEADVPVPPPPGQQQAGQTAAQQAEAPRRSTANKLLLIGCLGVVGVGVLFVGCLAVLAGGGGGGGRQPAEEFMAGEGAPPEDIRRCRVGQPCKMGTSTLTVTNVRMDDVVPITFDKPLTAGPYVFVDYTYTYGGDEVVSIAEYPQWPLNVGDKRYMPDFDATSSWSIEKDEDITVEDMQPGVPINGHLVYKVAPGSEDKTFILGVEDLIAPNKSKPAAIPVL